MKNIFKIAAVSLVLLIIGCDAVDDSNFPRNRESGWVEFNQSELYFLNTDTSTEIPIQYNVPINRVNTIITYNVEVVNGTNPGVEEGSFETIVPADTRDVSIPYEFLASDDGNYTVRFTITAVSNPDVIIGLDGDNPFVLDATVVRDFTGEALTPDCGPVNNTFDVSVDRTEEDGEFSVTSAWGSNYVAALTGNPGFEGLFLYEAIMSVSEDRNGGGNTIVSLVGVDPGLFPGSNLGVDEDGDPIEPCGEVSFNSDTGEINYSLSQNLFTGDFIVGVTLAPAVEEE